MWFLIYAVIKLFVYLSEYFTRRNDSAIDGPQQEVTLNNIKMVLIVRTDLKMEKGKIGAQCGHATLGAYKKALSKGSKYWQQALEYWDRYGCKKVCLKVKSEEELVEIYKKALEANFPTYLVIDAGKTQIAPNSKTV